MLAASCSRLNTGIISLCTGTRNPESMWRRHPENDSPEAWAEMVGSMEEAVRIAEKHRVTLAFEPEVNNVVDTAEKARRLLDEIASPHLKVLIDGANIFHAGELPRMREMLDHAFDILGDDIVMAHAKDLSRDGDAGHDTQGENETPALIRPHPAPGRAASDTTVGDPGCGAAHDLRLGVVVFRRGRRRVGSRRRPEPRVERRDGAR